MEPQFIDTTAALKAFLDGLPDCKGPIPSLYIDLEGNNLSRHGTLSIVTILVAPRKSVHLIDVTTLGGEAFSTCSSDGQTLKTILESSEIAKLFFDIRNDSDALYSLYDIRVEGIEDLQLMELASRTFSKRCVNGLAKCIEKDTTLGYAERQAWQRTKDKGRNLFDPARGGTYAVFDQRPLSSDMKEYCTQDVVHMPHLRERYRAKLCDAWWRKIETETEARIRLSQSPGYNGIGRHMAEAPRGWIDWHPTSAECLSRTLFEVPSQPEASARSSPERTSSSTEPHDVDELIRMVGYLGVGRADLRRGVGAAMSDDEFEDRWEADEYEQNEAKDFTACDSECGYCGACPY